MEWLENIAWAGGGGGIAVVAYLKVMATRLDELRMMLRDMGKKMSMLEEKTTDQEVRLRVVELQLGGDDRAQ